MVSRHTRLEGRETGSFADLVDSIDGAAPVAYKHLAFSIERDAGRDSEVARKFFGFFKRRDAIDGAVVSACDKHLTAGTERQTRWIDHLGQEGFVLASRRDFVNGDRNFLPSSSR